MGPRVWPLLFALVGCGHGDAASTGDSGAPQDAGPTRGYALASTGAQLLVTGGPAREELTPANLADDVDVIAVHQEFYGIPWDAFATGAPPPPEWVAVMVDLAKRARDATK